MSLIGSWQIIIVVFNYSIQIEDRWLSLATSTSLLLQQKCMQHHNYVANLIIINTATAYCPPTQLITFHRTSWTDGHHALPEP